tara:strand:+ start:75 stop:434 length:360 start_codon:yes stop_codon:yes gene_type:complete
MGLDMYAYRRKKGQSKDNMEEVMYWRKHNRLHGLMEDIYREKGGEDVFNCVTMRLKKKDMKRIMKTILGKDLKETQGFFFGEDSYEGYKEHYLKDDLAFVMQMKDAIDNGDKIYYSSWW